MCCLKAYSSIPFCVSHSFSIWLETTLTRTFFLPEFCLAAPPIVLAWLMANHHFIKPIPVTNIYSVQREYSTAYLSYLFRVCNREEIYVSEFKSKSHFLFDLNLLLNTFFSFSFLVFSICLFVYFVFKTIKHELFCIGVNVWIS